MSKVVYNLSGISSVKFGGFNLWRSFALRTEGPRSASLTTVTLETIGTAKPWIWVSGIEGVPVFKNDNIKNHFMDSDALVLMLGFTASYYHIGYSYDLQLSSLAVNGTGAHEISLIIEMGELFGCGLQYLDCFKIKAANNFNQYQPRNMKFH